jgi:hypothetical protein
MTLKEDRTEPAVPLPESDAEVISYLRNEITGGRHWYPALLSAIGLWSTAEEYHRERRYRYLVGGEAFDWLVLAERLSSEVSDLIPEAELQTLLFNGEPPPDTASHEDFRNLIGPCKHQQFLNFFYGIVVEEALVLVAHDEVRKAQQIWAPQAEDEIENAAYVRVYSADRATLLTTFRQEKGYRRRASISLDELKEFHYWRFKYRLRTAEKARIASDTRKGLDWLRENNSPWLRQTETGAP